MQSAPQTVPFVVTVTQLTQAIKLQLEESFSAIWVKGEISNLKVQSSGHIYFSIKDENAQVAAVMFRMDASRLNTPLKSGDQVIAKGELNVYPPKGNYQLIVRELSLVGIGELLMRVQALKQKLESWGWFSLEHKKQIPLFPQRMGVITSPTGAVIQDIIQILKRRLCGFHLILYPVKVQGDGAAQEIAQAIQHMNTYALADVLIVGRGGGSFEDLMPFNSEEVATAIHHSSIPIISAVGHETDTCIADWVADVRAPTPSAAAELVSQEHVVLLSNLQKWRSQIQKLCRLQLYYRSQQLQKLSKHPIIVNPYMLLQARMQSLDEMKELVEVAIKRYLENKKKHLQLQAQIIASYSPYSQIQERKKQLDQIAKNMALAIQRHIFLKKERFQFLQNHLAAINPKILLKKGYSILFSEKTKTIITSIHTSSCDDFVRIELTDGSLIAQIKEKHHHGD